MPYENQNQARIYQKSPWIYKFTRVANLVMFFVFLPAALALVLFQIYARPHGLIDWDDVWRTLASVGMFVASIFNWRIWSRGEYRKLYKRVWVDDTPPARQSLRDAPLTEEELTRLRDPDYLPFPDEH